LETLQVISNARKKLLTHEKSCFIGSVLTYEKNTVLTHEKSCFIGSVKVICEFF